MKRILWNEIKQTKIPIILFAVIMTIIMSISYVFCNVSIICLNVTDSIVKAYSEEPLPFNFDTIGSETVKILDSIGFDNIEIKYDYKNDFDDTVTLWYGDTEVKETLEFVRKVSKTFEEITSNKLISGDNFSDIENDIKDTYPIWINKTMAINYDMKCGDTVYLITTNNNRTLLTVKGIYSDVGNIPCVFSDYKSYDEIFKTSGISNKKSAYAEQKSYLKSRKTKKILEENRIYYESLTDEIDYYFNYYLSFSAVMMLIGIMVMGISVILFVTYSRLILIKRINYISLLLILGMDVKKAAALYSLILEGIVFITAVFSNVIIKLLYKYTVETISEMIKFDLENIEKPGNVYFVMIAVMSIYVLINYLFFKRKLKGIRETDIIRGIK